MSTTKLDYAALLKDALRQLDALQADLAKAQRVKTEPIAIVGMACRFPGADNLEQFWDLLQNGKATIGEAPPERWSTEAYYAAEPATPGKMYVRQGAFLDDVAHFDPHFFGISPQEAQSLDPQQRLLLEVGWEALEQGGQAPQQLNSSQTGVFVGIGQTDYAQRLFLCHDPTTIDIFAGTGNGACFTAGRLAYVLGLHGPALAVDTACSASLVAVHLACQSLRLGECELALAGGVQLMLSPLSNVVLSQMGALAPDGRCKTFDAAADGYGRGEGCGMIVLKRLTDAQQAGDTILAVIRGSAVNHDGPSSGLTVPNRTAQEALIRSALANAQIKPDAVSYIEAHGTGTALGDPIELRALHAVFGKGRTAPLWVGSVKTNIGHLEAAAGIAGLIKVVLALHHGEVPPHLHVQQPTPHVDWATMPLQIPMRRTPWSTADKQLADKQLVPIAGVSSFGLSGTNAHVILAAAPAPAVAPDQAETPARSWHLLTLSAKSEEALAALVARYQLYLAGGEPALLADLCYTASQGRNHFAHRLALVTASVDQLRSQLAAVANGQTETGLHHGYVSPRQAPPKIAFLFTGQGAQYVGMGRELYETQPVFRQTLDRCDVLLREHLGREGALSLRTILYPEAEDRRQGTEDTQHAIGNTLDDTTYTQPALFALEYALAMMWLSWGVAPALVMGHSVGEVAAACVAGVFSLEDGIKLIAARGRLMGALPQGGAMVVVSADEATVQQAIAANTATVAIAAVNGPQNVVISGQRAAVEAIAAAFSAQGVKTQPLTVSHAFHSPLMEPMLADFAAVAQTIVYHPPRIPMISNVTGQIAKPDEWQYWVRHVRQPVRFADGIQTLRERRCNICLEIGPKPTLLGMAQAILDFEFSTLDSSSSAMPPETQNPKLVLLPSLRKGQADWQPINESLAALYGQGIPIQWEAVAKTQGQPRLPRKVTLPTYPFQRQRFWVEWPLADKPATSEGQTQQTPVGAYMNGTGRNGGTMQANDGPAPVLIRRTAPTQKSELLTTRPEERHTQLQDYLRRIIGKAVGLSTTALAPEQPLMDLGLDSLMLIGLKQQIQREIGVTLPIDKLVAGLSIQQLAAQLQSHLADSASTSSPTPITDAVVAIQAEGRHPPFFCVHPIAGVVFPYYPLATCLGRDQPVYGLQAVEVNGQSASRIEDMAATYNAAIRTVQPHGPYYLGGWSFGAFVAFEMARQLAADGEPIGLLASFDQAAPANNKFTNTWKGLQFLVTTGVPNLWPHVRDYMQLARQTRSQNAARQQYHEQALGAIMRTMGANSQALLSYQPKPYSGPLTLFQTTAQLQGSQTDPTWGWDKLAQGGVAHIEVPGHHMNLLNEPYVNVLAEKLRSALHKAQEPALNNAYYR
jgi:acyl transferase domain-containing protein/thioesterase domain-containing protein